MNRVLVVDDHAVNLTLYSRIVSQLDECEAVTFQSSLQALGWAEFNEPALVICDHNMPAPNGVEFIERLRALRERAETPIVMVSAVTDRDVKRAALEHGASAFLLKPVDPVEFVHIMKNLLSARERRLEAITRAETFFEQTRDLTARLEQKDTDAGALLLRAIERHDRATYEHMHHVADVAAMIATNAGLSHHEQELLKAAASLHDVGKLAIPDRVLEKTTALSTGERKLIHGHARAGYEILHGGDSKLFDTAAEIALTHHENYDGSGYPGGLRGEAIPLFGRIVAIADTFAALRADRPYRKALIQGQAVQTIERLAGTRFDPRLVRAFRDAIMQARPTGV